MEWGAILCQQFDVAVGAPGIYSATVLMKRDSLVLFAVRIHTWLMYVRTRAYLAPTHSRKQHHQ